MPSPLAGAKGFGSDRSPWRVFRQAALRLLHGEHHAEPRLAAHHAIVGCSGFFEREGLDHGLNPGEGTKDYRLFRGSGGPGRPALNLPALPYVLNLRLT